MLYLALRDQRGHDLTQAQVISDEQDIPPHYLKQILSRLRGSGLIRSTRGPCGGHGLARAAEEISIAEIIQCLEGQLTTVDGILDMPCSISIGPKNCAIKEVLIEVKRRVESLLNETSLGALRDRQVDLIEASKRPQLVETTLLRRAAGGDAKEASP